MKFAILTFPGTSCEVDMHHAISTVVGGESEVVWHKGANISDYDGIIIPTGATFGDYLRPGALAKSTELAQQVVAFAATGKPVIGVGSGFHVLVELGLLPGAFLMNPSLKFETGKATVRVNNRTKFTSAYEQDAVIALPYAQQFGSYYVDEVTAKQLQDNNQVVFTYTGESFNSTAGIAGVVNEAGNVLGVMPLPERAVEEIIGGIDGLPFFESTLKNWSEQ